MSSPAPPTITQLQERIQALEAQLSADETAIQGYADRRDMAIAQQAFGEMSASKEEKEGEPPVDKEAWEEAKMKKHNRKGFKQRGGKKKEKKQREEVGGAGVLGGRVEKERKEGKKPAFSKEGEALARLEETKKKLEEARRELKAALVEKQREEERAMEPQPEPTPVRKHEGDVPDWKWS